MVSITYIIKPKFHNLAFMALCDLVQKYPSNFIVSIPLMKILSMNWITYVVIKYVLSAYHVPGSIASKMSKNKAQFLLSNSSQSSKEEDI